MQSREVVDAVTLCAASISDALHTVRVEVSIHRTRTRPPRPCQPLPVHRELTRYSSIAHVPG